MNRIRSVSSRSVFSHRLPFIDLLPAAYRFWLALALTILLGISLRTLWLDWQPIWWDEGYSIYFATESIPQMLALTARDIHPPLYYALLHTWITLTGSTEPATLRILSVIIGSLTLPVFAWLAHLLFRSRARTIVATLLLAISPMHLFYSQELRMYGLAMLLGLVATTCLWILLKQPSTRAILGYALAVSLTLYTIYYSAFLILAHLIWVLWYFRRDLKKCTPILIAYCIAALLYLPWLIYAATNLIRYVGEKIGFDNDTPLTPLQYFWRHLNAFTTGHLPHDNRILLFGSMLGFVGLIFLIGWSIWLRVGPTISPAAFGENEPSTGTPNLAARPAIWCWFAIPVVIGFLLNMRLPFFPDGGERLLLFVLPYFLLIVADGAVSCFGDGKDIGAELVAPHPRPLLSGEGTVTGQSLLSNAERDGKPQISSLPVWGGVGWGGKMGSPRINDLSKYFWLSLRAYAQDLWLKLVAPHPSPLLSGEGTVTGQPMLLGVEQDREYPVTAPSPSAASGEGWGGVKIRATSNSNLTAQDLRLKLVAPHPSPLLSGEGTVTGQPILSNAERDGKPQISSLPVWGGVGWGGKMGSPRINDLSKYFWLSLRAYAQDLRVKLVAPHPSPLLSGEGTVTGQPILSNAERDGEPQISSLPVWGGVGWGGKMGSPRINISSAIGTIAMLGLIISAGVGVYEFYTTDRYADRDYRPIVKQIVQQGGDDDTLLAIFPWQVGYWRAYAPAELRAQEPLLLGQSSLEWNDTIRIQIEDGLARGSTLWFPAPLSLGSDLPLEIEAYLAGQSSSLAELARSDLVEASGDETVGEESLLNLEMRWVNDATRLSAWRRVPALELSGGQLAEPFADFGELQLLTATLFPEEVASANSVIHVAAEWASLAELSRSETVEANDAPIDNADRIEWQFTLRLLDENGHSWTERTYRSLAAGRWRNDNGFVIPTGVPLWLYAVAIGVDRINVAAGEERATSLTANVPDNPQESVSFVRLGNLVITQPAEPMAPYRLPIDRAVAPLITDGGLTLLGLSGVDPEKSALAGTRISLDIFLQNQSSTPPLRSLYVSLLDDDGAGIAGGERAYPTEQLAAGALLQVPFEVELPATLVSGTYRLIAGFVDPSTGAKSPAAALGVVRVTQRAAAFDAPVVPNELLARFGSHVDLLGYDMLVEERIRLTLYWRVDQSLLPQHNIFVHLVGDVGDDPLAQWDGVPQSIGAGGELILAPTGSWQAGEFLSTQHLLPLADDVDEFALHIGLYVPETGARLPVAIDGNVVGDFVRIDSVSE